MKIFHVITGLRTGGAERGLLRLLKTLPSSEFKQVVTVLGPEDDESGNFRATGTKIVHLGMRANPPNPLALIKLRRLMDHERPNIIHGWMYHANVATALSCYRAAPLLWGIRQSLYDLDHEKFLTRKIIRQSKRMTGSVSSILYNSKISARQHEALGYDSTKTKVIPNGFDAKIFHPDLVARERLRVEFGLSGDTLVIGMVARWHPIKNHIGFFHAAALFLRSYPNARFVLVGPQITSSNSVLMQQIQTAGLTDKVILCGPRQDIAAINTVFNISTLSSLGEAFPNVLGEAMACGVPCVTTDVGDAAEIVGNTGIVVPRDDPQALSDGWGKLTAMGASGRAELGLRARQRIKNLYDLRAVADQYASFYRELAGR